MNVFRFFCLIMLLPVLADAAWKARVDDVVSPRVVSIVMEEGELEVGNECLVLRKGVEVGRLRIRSASGVCRVLSGDIQEGDQVLPIAPAEGDELASEGQDAPEQVFANIMTNPAPAAIQALLRAEGTLELAARLAPDEVDEELEAELDYARDKSRRVYPALGALLSKTKEARVAAALREVGRPGLADQIAPDAIAATRYHLAPEYPADHAKGPPYNALGYGRVNLLDGASSLWAMPGRWGQEPGPADLSGWMFDGDTLTVTNPVGGIVRSDFGLGDAELTGEVKVSGGQGVYLILRSDVVIRFYPGTPSPNTGNVGVRFGHHNLRQLSAWGQAPVFGPDEWVPFSARLENNRLTVRVANSNVMEVAVTESGPASVTLDRGHYGFGSFDRSGGGFRKVVLTALTVSGQRAIPRFATSTGYENDGEPLHMLTEVSRFKALVHNRMESHKAQHRVEDGVLSLQGAPYAQFTLADMASDHYSVRGRIRWTDEGSVWFRAHSKLMLGLRLSEEEASPYLVKHSTGNFHFANQRISGPAFKKDKWYDWEFTYHAPGATLRVNNKTIGGSWTEALKSAGPVQFGVSSYNCPVDLSDMVMQPLKVRRYALDESALRDLIAQGRKELETAIEQLETDYGEESQVALAILAGERGPEMVSPEELREVAQDYRAGGDWTTYLDILEADITRYSDEETQEDVRKVWARAKEKYELALETTGAGEVGLDRILRLNEDDATVNVDPIAVGATGSVVRVFVPGRKSIVELNAAEHRTEQITPVGFEPLKMIDRVAYLICAVSGETNELLKVEWPSGDILQRVSLDGRFLDMVAGHDGLTYLSTDGNEDEGPYDFGACRIYELDEETWTLKKTDAIGQQLESDPYGRYLYAGFSHVFSPERMPDPSFLRVMPMGFQMDHLVRYTLLGESLEFSGERARPGFFGSGIVASPDGHTVNYVARNGFIPLPMGRSIEQGVPAFSASRLSRVSGVYPFNLKVAAMAYNRVTHEAYILTQSGLQAFAPGSYEPSRKLIVPESIRKGDVRQMLASGDGRHLLIAMGGDGGGVFMTAVDGQGESPLPDQREWLFTSAGERESKAYFSREDAPYSETADCSAAIQPEPQVDAETLDRFESIRLPKLPELYSPEKQDEDLTEMLDDLDSFHTLAETFPYSLLKRAQGIAETLNTPAAFQLRIAAHLKTMGQGPAACRILNEVIEEAANPVVVARGYLQLAENYQGAEDLARALSATRQAVKQDPGNAYSYVRLAGLLEKAGLTNAAANERMMAVHLLPSLEEEWENLRKAGITVPSRPESLSRTALFGACSAAVVLVRHGKGVGTGFVIGRAGLLLTNHHVIDGHADDIMVTINAGGDAGEEGKYPAVVLASDARRDMALLQISKLPESMTPLRLTSSADVRTGDTITAIGNPGMGSQVLSQTATEGIVSNAGRRLGALRFIQISAAVNPGNSGGPLLNQRGEVIGMVTLKAQLENVGFAVPSDALLEFVEKYFQ